MKHPTSLIFKTKKGNRYNWRENKVAMGFSKMSADRQFNDDRFGRGRSKYDDVLLPLIVYGTTDVLAKKFMYLESKVIHHPTDSSFTKRIKVLGKDGKRKLKRLRSR